MTAVLTPRAIDRMLDALNAAGAAPRATGTGYMAKCPTHDDRQASLAVSNGAGKAVLHCHAGCHVEDIVGALGLKLSDLFDETLTREKSVVIATYDYTDENGVLLYQKQRKLPHSFTIRRPVGNGWKYTLDDTRRVLYRLPELITGIAAGDIVYIVEGEKDANRLARLGHVATCNFDGASTSDRKPKWLPAYNSVFDRANVVIIADNDPPGIAHARNIAANLKGIAARTRLARGAVNEAKADVSDHLNAGLTLDELIDLPLQVPAESPLVEVIPLDAGREEPGTGISDRYPVVDWRAAWLAEPGACDWLVEPIIERGRIYAIYAPAKAGKSLLCQDIAAGLATGRAVLGNAALEPLRVLYVDLENSIADIIERMSAYGYGPGDLDNLRYLSFPSLPALDSVRGGRDLVAVVEHHAAQVVIIDTVSRVIDGKENDSDTFHALYRHAMAPLKAHGITVIRLDHGGKDADRGQRGSSAKATDVDTVWKLEQIDQTHRALTREASRTMHHPERVDLVQRFEPLRHELCDRPHPQLPDPDAALGVTAAVAELERMRVPLAMGRDRARAMFTAAGLKVRNETLTEALRTRRFHAENG